MSLNKLKIVEDVIDITGDITALIDVIYIRLEHIENATNLELAKAEAMAIRSVIKEMRE